MCITNLPKIQVLDLQAPAQAEPVITIEAQRVLFEAGWNLLHGWLRENAPAEIFTVASGLDFLACYAREAGQGGDFAAELNDQAGQRVLELVNALSRAGWI